MKKKRILHRRGKTQKNEKFCAEKFFDLSSCHAHALRKGKLGWVKKKQFC